MKILKRNYGHRNLILFLILSLVYLQAIYSLSRGQSLFSVLSLQSFFFENYIVLFLTLVTVFLVLKIKRFSEIFLLICLSIIVGKNFILLSNSFNKLTLALNFIYLVFAFYFYISWELEVVLASFNPRFTINDLVKEPRFKLRASIGFDESGVGSVPVLVTNIDHESCFLLMPKESTLELTSSRLYFLQSNFDGVIFRHKAHIVSSYDRGIGLVFDDSDDARLSWSELYKVCLERGIVT